MMRRYRIVRTDALEALRNEALNRVGDQVELAAWRHAHAGVVAERDAARAALVECEANYRALYDSYARDHKNLIAARNDRDLFGRKAVRAMNEVARLEHEGRVARASWRAMRDDDEVRARERAVYAAFMADAEARAA